MNDIFDFFISYRRAAAGPIVRSISGALNGLNYKTFLDVEALKNSNDWKRSIDDNLSKSRVMLVVLAKGSFDSGQAHTGSDEFLYEISKAKEMAKPLITIDYGGFFSAKELQHIRDESIVKWLNGPTALSYETDSWANLTASIVERMSNFEREIDSFGRHLSEEYIEEQMAFLRLKATKFFENDGRIDRLESNQLFMLGKQKHLSVELVDKVIHEVESNSRPYIPTQPTVEVATTNIVAQRVTVEPPDSSNVTSPSPSKNGFSSSAGDEAPSNQHVNGDVVRDSTPDDLVNWDYHTLGEMKAGELLAHSEARDLIERVATFAEKSNATVRRYLEASDPDGRVKNAVKHYTRMLDPVVLAERNVASARELELEKVIAEAFGVTDLTLVEKILRDTHGRTKLGTAFAQYWPVDEVPDDTPDDLLNWDYHALGEMKVGELLAHSKADHLIAGVAMFAEKTNATVRRYLEASDPDARVKFVVKHYTKMLDPTLLASYTVASARELDLEKVIAEAFSIADSTAVTKILSESHGRTLLGRAFAGYWPK